MGHNNIAYDIENGIAEITLERPEKLNALTDLMVEEFVGTLRAAYIDQSVGVVIITGAGRGFCSGGDVSGMPDRDPTDVEFKLHLVRFQEMIKRLLYGRKPTIAAINGPAAGAGMDIATACDFRLMSESADMRAGFIDIGLVPGVGGAWLLPELIGTSKAKEYILSNEPMTPEEAAELGLLVDVVGDEELMESARDFAVTLRDKPRMASERTKQLIDQELSYDEYCQQAYEYQLECLQDEEHREAAAAFVEGRKPEFQREY